MKKRKLTPKQLLFAQEYLKDLNATQAYIRAGYSPNGAKTSAPKLLANTCIQEIVNEHKVKRSERTNITADRILEELGNIAFANASDFFEETAIIDEETGEVKGYIRSIKAKILDSDKIAALSSFEPGAYGTKLKMNCKMKALEMISRHVGLFNADTSSKPETNTTFDLSNVSSEKLRKLEKVWNDDKKKVKKK